MKKVDSLGGTLAKVFRWPAEGSPEDGPAERQPLRTRVARRGQRMFGATSRKGVTSLVDQVVTSAASFLTVVLVGRACGPGELGIYAMGFSFVVVGFFLLQSLIWLPYTIHSNRLQGRARAEYAGAVLVHLAVLCLTSSLALFVSSIALWLSGVQLRLAPVLLVLAAAIPFHLLREFARRHCYARLHAKTALVVDIAVAVLQVGGLAALVLQRELSAVSANVVYGSAVAIVSLGWLAWSRRDFALRRSAIIPAVRRNWTLGSWGLATDFVATFRSHLLVLWALALIVNEAAAGIFAAAATIVRLANPFVLAFGQLLIPRLAHAYGQGGIQELRRVSLKALTVVALIMGSFCLVILVAGSEIMEVLYGHKYTGQALLISLMALASLASVLSTVPGAGLLTTERPKENFKAELWGCLATAVVALSLVVWWGVPGVVSGLVVGQVVVFLLEWTAFTKVLRAKVEVSPGVEGELVAADAEPAPLATDLKGISR